MEKYEPLRRLMVYIEDSLMKGEQNVTFEPSGDGVEIDVMLEYRVKRRSPFTPLVEWLFVRRPMIISLTRTLERFGASLG